MCDENNHTEETLLKALISEYNVKAVIVGKNADIPTNQETNIRQLLERLTGFMSNEDEDYCMQNEDAHGQDRR